MVCCRLEGPRARTANTAGTEQGHPEQAERKAEVRST